MLDLSIYDFLEKIVNEKEETLEVSRKLCECEEEDYKLGINSLQSIMRSSVTEEQKEEYTYSKIVFGKEGYASIKLGNIKVDLENIISLLSNIPGIVVKEKWAMIMAALAVVSELKKLKIKLSPSMGMIVEFLYKNNYLKRTGRSIDEEILKAEILKEFNDNITGLEFEKEFSSAMDELVKIKSIEICGGKIMLIEEVKI